MLEFFREDLEKHIAGTPCYIDGACFYVARLGTKESQKQIRQIKETLYGLIPNPREFNEDEIYANWLASFGVVNWSDVDFQSGNIEFSRQDAARVFLNEEYYLSLNKVLISHALNYENYLHDEALEEEENVKK